MLNSEEKKELLNIARKSIEGYLDKSEVPVLKSKSFELSQKNGVFVTLHKKNGDLRGCIGRMNAEEPLYKTVSEMAVESAFGDPRFEKVDKEELKNLIIEISILSPMQKINNTNEIKLGIHGVLVKRGFNSGVFLPQVATETGWNLEEFMSNLCAGKAGIPADSWKDKTTNIYVFTVEIISEKH